jgi:hypothetical protein
VVHELDVGAAASARERHPQRVEHEVGAHVTASCQPTIRRRETSMTKLKNTTPSQQRR